MNARRGITLLVCALLTGVLAIGLYAQKPAPRPRPKPPPPARKVEKPPQPTRFQIDVFELACKNEKLVKLDIGRLNRNKDNTDGLSSEEVLKALSELGSARLAVRIDNTVDLAGESQLTFGKDMPQVTDLSIKKDGAVTPAISYREVGFRWKILGRWLDNETPPRASVEFNVQYSNMVKSGLDLGKGVDMPAFNKLSITQSLILTSGKPVLIAANDLVTPGDPDAMTYVTIVRLVVTRLSE